MHRPKQNKNYVHEDTHVLKIKRMTMSLFICALQSVIIYRLSNVDNAINFFFLQIIRNL